jgi:hypothetical protein
MIRADNITIKFMKVLSILTLLFLCFPKSYAQSEDFKMTVTVLNTSAPDKADGSIQIKIDGKEDQYIYMLFNKKPWDGGKELSPDASAGSDYSFTNLTVGDYFICVRYKDEVTRCKDVTVKSN